MMFRLLLALALAIRTNLPGEKSVKSGIANLSSVYGPLSMVLWCKARRGTAPTSCRTPPKDLLALLFPRGLHVVDLLKLQIYFVPTIGVTPRGSVVVMTWDSYVAEAGG